MTKRATSSSKLTSVFAWWTWAFTAESIVKGGLQAVGSIFVYAFVILWIINKSDAIRRAIQTRLAPALEVGGGKEATA